MDENLIFEELTNMHSNISSLFQDIINERNKYKCTADELKKKLNIYLEDMVKLKKQNNELLQTNEKFKYVIYKSVSLMSHANFSKTLKKDYESILELCKQKAVLGKDFENLIQCSPYNLISLKKTDAQLNTKNTQENFKCIKVHEHCNRDEHNQSNFCYTTKFLDDDGIHNHEENYYSRKWSMIEKNKFSSSTIPDHFSTFVENTIIQDCFQSTPEKCPHNLCENKSPVFKDLGNKSYEHDKGDKGFSSNLVREKYCLKTANLTVCPLKRNQIETNSESPKKAENAPKQKKLKSEKFSKRRCSQLKKPNYKGVVVSPNGSKRVTQTFLNIEVLKNKRRKMENYWNETINDAGSSVTPLGENEFSGQVDEDDVIYGSPKTDELLQEPRTNRIDLKNSRPEVVDLDETYISSATVRNCKFVNPKCFEIDTTVVERIARERSPEYDSVPFVYKRDAVRKKTERMKMPGRTCLECNKYYKQVFGDQGCPGVLQEILNKCSRHRSKTANDSEETPPGYWKPYLTATVATPGTHEA